MKEHWDSFPCEVCGVEVLEAVDDLGVTILVDADPLDAYSVEPFGTQLYASELLAHEAHTCVKPA